MLRTRQNPREIKIGQVFYMFLNLGNQVKLTMRLILLTGSCRCLLTKEASFSFGPHTHLVNIKLLLLL